MPIWKLAVGLSVSLAALGCSPVPVPIPSAASAPPEVATTGPLERVASFHYPSEVYRIAFAPDGDLWLQGFGACVKVAPTGERKLELPNGPAADMGVDSHGNLWASSAGGQLRKFAPGGETLVDQDRKFGDWFSFPLLVDRTDHVWTPGRKLGPDGQTVLALPGLDTRNFLEGPDGAIWAVSPGLRKLSATGELLGTYLAGRDPLTGAFDGVGNIWLVAQPSGDDPDAFTVLKVSPTGEQVARHVLGQHGATLAATADGEAWLVPAETRHELVRLDAGATPVATVRISGVVTALAVDHDGLLWVAEQQDYRPYQTTVTRYRIRPGG